MELKYVHSCSFRSSGSKDGRIRGVVRSSNLIHRCISQITPIPNRSSVHHLCYTFVKIKKGAAFTSLFVSFLSGKRWTMNICTNNGDQKWYRKFNDKVKEKRKKTDVGCCKQMVGFIVQKILCKTRGGWWNPRCPNEEPLTIEIQERKKESQGLSAELKWTAVTEGTDGSTVSCRFHIQTLWHDPMDLSTIKLSVMVTNPVVLLHHWDDEDPFDRRMRRQCNERQKSSY